MKYVIASLVFAASVTAGAATVSTGKYDCSRKVGSLIVDIAAVNDGYVMTVNATNNNFTSSSRGFATVVSYTNEMAPEKNTIRLPGTNYAFYFDGNGGLGLNFRRYGLQKDVSMLSFLAALILNSNAWAHGNMIEQAEGATSTCLKHMLKVEEKRLVRQFKSVHTEVAGTEVFSVTVTLKDGRTLAYTATGVDGTQPDQFSWACTKK